MFRANKFNILATKGAIASKYGEKESLNYIPNVNCLTFNAWRKEGYKVKKGEKAISRITTFIENKEKTKKYPHTCCLFYKLQVEKV